MLSLYACALLTVCFCFRIRARLVERQGVGCARYELCWCGLEKSILVLLNFTFVSARNMLTNDEKP